MRELIPEQEMLTIILPICASFLSFSVLLVLCIQSSFFSKTRDQICSCWGICCDKNYAQGVDPNHPAFRDSQITENNNVVFEPLPEHLSTAVRVENSEEVNDGKGIKRSNIRFTDTIGHGWFGWIVSGNVAEHGKVVIKILREEARPEEFERFKCEHEVWATVHHQNVVRTVGFCFNSFPMLSLLEWCEYSSVKTFLIDPEQTPNLDLSLQLSMDASAGVAALHNYNIIVPDLAARNCVLTTDRVLKIGDYGLGRAAFPADYWPLLTDSVPLRWLAPRQLTRSEHRTIPTYSKPLMEDNLWSLAILIWEFLTYCKQPYGNTLDRDIIEILLSKRSVNTFFKGSHKEGLRFKCVITLICQSLHMDPLARLTAAQMENQLGIVARASQQEIGNLLKTLTEQGTLAGFQEVDISDYQEEFNLNNPSTLELK